MPQRRWAGYTLGFKIAVKSRKTKQHAEADACMDLCGFVLLGQWNSIRPVVNRFARPNSGPQSEKQAAQPENCFPCTCL